MEQNINHSTANVISVNQSTRCEWTEINILDLDPHGVLRQAQGRQLVYLPIYKILWL